MLLGDPGVGKTALPAAAATRAERRGVRVVATAGVEYEARVSYGGLGRLVEAATAAPASPAVAGALAVALGREDGPGPSTKAWPRPFWR